MPKMLDTQPWKALPEDVADVIEPELPAITAEILETIAREVPEYARPLEGRFGRGIRTGVGEALAQFVGLIRDSDRGRERGREVYVELGRGEQRVGRTLDSLQAAYRVGARVAWRRFAAAAQRAELDSEHLALLAEAIFAYIDELSADSVEGYAEAQAAVEDLRRRRRQELASLLLRDRPPTPEDLAATAKAADWPLPARLAVAACWDRDLAAVSGRLPAGSLATAVEGVGCVIVADPDGPGRRRELGRAAGRATLALGPSAEPTGAARSHRLAVSLLRAAAVGAVHRAGDATESPAASTGGLLVVEDHLAELLLFDNPELIDRLASRRLAPLRDLTPKASSRMRETALAHVRHNGNAVAMAGELHVHPQTARYRIARLRELFGDALDDPDARFELELALRGYVVPSAPAR